MKVIDHQREFRNALGSFATGIAVVTTIDTTGNPIGMTINSFASVSLDPPLVLWSIGKSSAYLNAFITSQRFAIHVLKSDQEAISNAFAARDDNKFELVDWLAGPHGIPLLHECCSRFVCGVEQRHEGGDHIILVGRVMDFEYRDSEPLLFHCGQYKSLAR